MQPCQRRPVRRTHAQVGGLRRRELDGDDHRRAALRRISRLRDQAHGLAGVKEMRLDAYAERFCAAGLACLVFDYRHFGESAGEPRQLLDIQRQTLHEGAAPDQWHCDEVSGQITVTPGASGQTRHTVTLSLSGTAAFGAALRERFGLD